MSPSGKSVKRQRANDVTQDVKASPNARTKRLKTDQDIQKTPKGDVVVAASNVEKKAEKEDPRWSLDLMFRGEIYDIDPIISTDEKYIFLSRGNAVQVFSVSTHRPVRTLITKDSSHVTGLKLVPSDSRHLYVSTSSNKLIQWDWDTNEEVMTRSNFPSAVAYEIVPVQDQTNEERMAYFAVKTKGSRSTIIANRDWLLRKDSTDIVLLEITFALTHFKVLQGGQVIVACARQHLVIGTLSSKSDSEEQTKEYEWRQFRLPNRQVTCLDVRETISATSKSVSVDIAVGDTSGAILVYNDVMSSINRDHASGEASKFGLPLLQRLHWHREPVASLRWTQDGNYIISGGKESTIVFWQLDSGRKNFLPHLPSPIRSITASSVGALYAVQLADRSISILSAIEMNSVATIDGLQLPSSVNTSMDTKGKDIVRSLDRKFPVILHPRESEKLLVAIPGGESQSLSFLQTFNIETGTHISRQALARTNVTIMNKGPEGTPILPPNVDFIEISDNGEWLATVDTWNPPEDDVEASSAPLLPDGEQSQNRSEVYLKFWRWSETQEIWELATRVDSPHLASSGNAVKVLSLKARPDRSEFVTFGADNTIKVWQPTVRYSKSVKSQRRSNFMEYTWKNQTSLVLTGYAGHDSPSGAMAFSEDGSILAMCMKNVVHLIDTRPWTVYCSRNVFTFDKIRNVEFQGRYLVALSEQSLAVWNVVEETLQTAVKSALASQGAYKYIALAVDASTDTFAIVTQVANMAKSAHQPSQHGQKSAYSVAVYSTSTMTLLSETMLEKVPVKLLTDPSMGGYIAIDVAANVWRLRRQNKALQAQALTPTAGRDQDSYQRAATGFHDIFGRVGQKALEPRSVSNQQTNSTLTLQNLGGIFDRAPPFALPPASALFEDVIKSLVSSS